MPLTGPQYATLKADIAANADLNSQPNSSDGHFEIARLYNLPAAPAYRVWRTDLPTKDVKKAIVWTEYIGRSVGERSAFELMISNGILNAGDSNVRQGIIDCFSGPSGVGTRTNLTNIAKRDATRVEKLLASGAGSEATPSTLTFEGTISYQDIADARAS